ncbi:MAG TPA: lipocalin family protein [Chitinophagaceae bacterium]|nr:lipocalin family protein [Chitinophagaceae bacterium]
MKTVIIPLLAGVLFACNNNNAQDAKTAEVKEESKAAANTENNQPSGDGIAGYWKLKLETSDDNENKILDEAERKKAFKNNYTFRFNADGSCKIQESFAGRYEVKTEGGKKMLYVYRKRVVGEEDQDPVPDVYRIISMDKKELVLLESIGNLTFWIFERAG